VYSSKFTSFSSSLLLLRNHSTILLWKIWTFPLISGNSNDILVWSSMYFSFVRISITICFGNGSSAAHTNDIKSLHFFHLVSLLLLENTRSKFTWYILFNPVGRAQISSYSIFPLVLCKCSIVSSNNLAYWNKPADFSINLDTITSIVGLYNLLIMYLSNRSCCMSILIFFNRLGISTRIFS